MSLVSARFISFASVSLFSVISLLGATEGVAESGVLDSEPILLNAACQVGKVTFSESEWDKQPKVNPAVVAYAPEALRDARRGTQTGLRLELSTEGEVIRAALLKTLETSDS